jgi:hypothetical protein
VIIGCPGASASGDVAEDVIDELHVGDDVVLSAGDVAVLDMIGFVVDGVDGGVRRCGTISVLPGLCTGEEVPCAPVPIGARLGWCSRSVMM